MITKPPSLRVLLIDDGAHRVPLIRDELTRLGYVVVGMLDSAGKPAVPAPAARVPFDWRGLWLKVLPPVIGLALMVGIWALLTMKSTTFPTSAATFDAAVKLFADPFYSKGANDQGIGWNILFSLERVAVGFGMAGAAHDGA